MSEKYVKDILEKLEEIEKLHAKLRSLVPRVKNHDSENSSKIAHNGSKNMNNQSRRIFPEQKPVDINSSSNRLQNIFRHSKASIKKSNSYFAKYLPRIRNSFPNDKWRKFRKDSIDFVTTQWYDKHNKIKDFLSTINDDHIIVVNRGMQTLNGEQESTPKNRSVTGNEVFILCSREDQFPEKKRHTRHQLLERLLEHFNYSRDDDIANENRVSIHGHLLGNCEPREVQKTLLPDEEDETLKVVTSARRVSVDDNRESSSSNRVSKFKKKYSNSL